MSALGEFVPLSVRYGIRPRQHWEQSQREMRDDPYEHPDVRAALRGILEERKRS